MSSQVYITSTPESFAVEAAAYLWMILEHKKKKQINISLSGGSTPFPVYRELAEHVKRQQAFCRKVWFQTDERLVSHTDPRSNQHGLQMSLFKCPQLRKKLCCGSGQSPAKQLMQHLHAGTARKGVCDSGGKLVIDLLIAGTWNRRAHCFALS